MRSLHRTLAVVIAVAFAVPAAAQTDGGPYDLSSSSRLTWGCLGACACPVIWTGAVTGGFTLVKVGDSNRFSYYTVRDIAWSYVVPGTARVAHVTGEGTYQFGFGSGDSLVQKMQLALVTDGKLAQHFDSGFVPYHWEFPAIDIELDVNMSGCPDSVMHVVAAPSSASTGPRPHEIQLATAPNPTSASVEIVVELPEAGPVTVDVLDLHGRTLVTLVDRPLPAGQTPLRWDGHVRTGRDAGTGVIWVRARMGSRQVATRIVRFR